MISKSRPVRSKKLRRSAKGQECTVRFPGICAFDTETTVLAHLPDGNKGMGTKSSDIHAVFACDLCHMALDSKLHPDMDKGLKYRAMLEALARTQQIWVEQGLITVEGNNV